MCGIAAIAIGRRARTQIPYPKLQALAKALLEELEVRGVDASGIAVLNEPTMAVSTVFKKPLRPSRLVARPKFQEVLETITPATNFVLLHARATTSGNTSNNFNNHPIIVPGCIGVHNGTLANDDELFKKYGESFDRLGEVDSEVIFQLFKYFADQGKDCRSALQETAKNLSGAFTGAVVDGRYPRRMLLFKHERPLCIVSIPHYDIMIAVSESCFYTRAAAKVGISPKASFLYAHDGTGLIVDLDVEHRITEKLYDFQLPIEHTIRVKIKHSQWMSSYTGYGD